MALRTLSFAAIVCVAWFAGLLMTRAQESAVETQVPPVEFICPMDAEVRSQTPGKCPRCGMALVPEHARFPIVRHLLARPMMLAIMFAAMFALMAGAMLMMR